MGDSALNAAAFVVCPVPPLARGKVPVTPVDNGRSVALVNTKVVGVPKFGVVNIGEFKVLFVNVSVPATVANVLVTAGSVMVAEPETAGATIVAEPVLGDAPAKATEVADATPNVGVTKVGEVAKTKAPEPVSLLITPANSDEVVAAKTLSLSVV
jgi:hypothetical protein